MKIAVDLSSLEDHLSGLERYAMCLTRAMLRLDTKNEYVLVFKNQIHPAFFEYQKTENVRCIIKEGRHKLWFNQVTLPALMKKTGADIFLFPAFPVPFFFRSKNIYGLIADTCFYDCPETMPLKSKWFFRVMAKHTAKISEQILTISNFSKERILHYYKVDKKKILTLYCGVENGKKEDITMDEVRQKYDLPEEYLLSLATIEPRKNIGLLLEAYGELKQEDVSLPPLVLAGRMGWMMKEKVEEYSEKDKDIRFTGFISDEDLGIIYEGALAFIFPSMYEGFGMPPLEAQKNGGKTVIVSDIPPHREVLLDTAVYFATGDKEALKACLKSFSEGTLKEISADKIKMNLQRFTWENAAEKLLNAIEEK